MTLTMARRRYAWARDWRTCPACGGYGRLLDLSRITFVPCYLCTGGGEVRYNRRVSLRIALRMMTPRIRENLAAELAARRRMA